MIPDFLFLLPPTIIFFRSIYAVNLVDQFGFLLLAIIEPKTI